MINLPRIHVAHADNANEGDHRAISPLMRSIFSTSARLDHFGMAMLRFGLVLVLVWIGGIKFAKYEAEGIVPLVANSPLMSFFYHHPAPEYRRYMNKEGELVPVNEQWHESNGTALVAFPRR